MTYDQWKTTDVAGDEQAAREQHEDREREAAEEEYIGSLQSTIDVLAAAAKRALWWVPDPERIGEHYEEIAEAFRRDTGLMAPGKDVAAAVGNDASSEDRRKTWNEWRREQSRQIREQIHAALKMAGER